MKVPVEDLLEESMDKPIEVETETLQGPDWEHRSALDKESSSLL